MLNGRLYVTGGDRCDKLQVLEMSAENEFSWTVKAELPAPRYSAASAVVDGKIWLMGGRYQGGIDESVLVYDTASDSWAVGRAPLPRPVRDCRAAVLDTQLYIVAQGGFLRHRDGEWIDVAGAQPIAAPACESILLN